MIKGKAFRKSEFGTGIFDKTLHGTFAMRSGRPPGDHAAPMRLDLPAQGISSGEPVRIYIGTEPAQHRAERVLLWSVLKHRNPAREYQLYLMKDLAGFDRSTWKTGFTAYRYVIPEFAGFSGRAIYNDVDQIYLADPANLCDLDMGEAGVLAVDSRDTSVMLMQCDRLRDAWNADAVRANPGGKIHTPMLRRVRQQQLIDDLPGCWNSRDHEYDASSSCLLHYTILHTQPWQPFPRDLRYQTNPLASLWLDLEDEADKAGFAPAWKREADSNYEDMAEFFTVVKAH